MAKKKGKENPAYLSTSFATKIDPKCRCLMSSWLLSPGRCTLKDLDVNLKLIQAFWVQKLDWKSFKSRLSHKISVTSLLTDKPQVSEKHPFVCYLWIVLCKRRCTRGKKRQGLLWIKFQKKVSINSNFVWSHSTIIA